MIPVSGRVNTCPSVTLVKQDQKWIQSKSRGGQSITLQGHSVAAQHTCFWVKDLSLLFDAGLSCYYLPRCVLLTHCHSDHSGMLPAVLTGQPKPVSVVLPQESTPALGNLLDAHTRFVSNRPEAKAKTVLTSVSDNDVVPLHNSWSAVVHALDHTVPAVGYTIVETRKRLKAEYRGLSGAELIQLKQAAESQPLQLQETYSVKLMSYLCDTSSVRAIELLQSDKLADLVMLECTFLEDTQLAKSKGHVCWMDIEDTVVALNGKCHLILFHFSARYDNSAIIKFFRERQECHACLSDVALWLPEVGYTLV